MKTSNLNFASIFILAIFSMVIIYGCSKTSVTPAASKLAANNANTTTSTKTDTIPVTPVKTTYSTVPLTGDQITLVPHYYKSQTADSSYLYFIAQTHNYYCGISTIDYTANIDASGNYAVNFIDVSQPSPCTIGQLPLGQAINFNHSSPNTIPNGTFPLSVTLNGTTYSGSIAATATTITFTWNYTAGVLIAPNQVSR
jgi:hypothetical protein